MPGDQYFRFGAPGDEPLVGDWDGDGTDEVGVHRGDAWYLDGDGNHQWNLPGDVYFRFGILGDEPVVGDWDGDGTDEVGVHRPSTGMWYLDTDGNGRWNVPGDVCFRFGVAGDEPVVGDWNGDGVDEVGVHRDHMWYLDSDGNHRWSVPGDEYFGFGIAGDEPVVGRWQSGAGGLQGASGQSESGGISVNASSPAILTTVIASLSPPPAESPTGGRAPFDFAEVDSVFASEGALLQFEGGATENVIDALAGEVSRPRRLGSAGILGLQSSRVRDQVIDDLLQSAWQLDLDPLPSA